MSDAATEKAFEIDLSELELTDEGGPIEGFDPDADPNEAPPPVDDGEHIVKLRISPNKPKVGGKKMQGNTEYWLFVSGTVINPGGPGDGRPVDGLISTFTRDNGGSTAGQFLSKAGVSVAELSSMSRALIIKKVGEILQGEPQATIESKWEASGEIEGKNKTILRGQKRFPVRKKGGYQPLTEDPKTGAEVRTRASIVRYISIG